jgi:hypothetical protein
VGASTSWRSSQTGSQWSKARPVRDLLVRRYYSEMSDPLRELALLESRDVLTRRFQDTHGREPNAQKCRAIGAHLLQGRQYWESAAQSGDLIRPLLLYYGTLSLCRALILFCRRNGGEESLSKSHGLEAKEWGEEFSARGPASVLDFKVTTSSGTLEQLAESTCNAETTRFYIPPYPAWTESVRRGTAGSVAGATVTLRDLIKRVPELAITFERLTGDRSAAYPARVHVIEGKLVDLELLKTPWGPATWNSVRTDLVVPAGIPIEVAVPAFYDRVPVSRMRVPWDKTQWLWPRIAMDESGQSWAVAPVGEGRQWSQLVILFALAYCLGILVRYYPTVWLALSSQPRGDIAFPLIREARITIEQSVPRLVLQLMELRTMHGPLLDQDRR